MGFLSSQPTTNLLPHIRCCLLLVSFLKLSLDHLLLDYSFSSFRPPTSPGPVPRAQQFPGLPRVSRLLVPAKARSGEAPASHSSSMAQLASPFLRLFRGPEARHVGGFCGLALRGVRPEDPGCAASDFLLPSGHPDHSPVHQDLQLEQRQHLLPHHHREPGAREQTAL